MGLIINLSVKKFLKLQVLNTYMLIINLRIENLQISFKLHKYKILFIRNQY